MQLVLPGWPAVVAAALAATVIGVIWYLPPTFGGPWARLVSAYARIPEAELMEPRPQRLLIWLVTFLVQATVLGLLARTLGLTGAVDALLLGFMTWLGFGATFSAWPAIFARWPWRIYVINNAAFLTQQLVMSAIVTLWV